MALLKSERKVEVQNHIPPSGILFSFFPSFFRGHFGAHFEGHVQEQTTLTTWHWATESSVWCKSAEGLQVLIWECRTVGWLGSGDMETQDTLPPQRY